MKVRATLLLSILSLLIFACTEETDPVINTPEQQIELSYGDHPLQKYTLNTPPNSNNETRVIILIHGGGWVMGYHPDGEVTTFTGRYNWDIQTPLLEAGFACATMKYRTACYNTQPEHFGSNSSFYIDRMMEDIDLVINDLKSNSINYNISSNHFQLVGESAGGHIAMYYGIRQNSNPDLKSVVSMFGPTNLDDTEFKLVLDSLSNLSLLLAEPPNYFLKKSDDCSSVSNKQVRLLSSLKSFADHHELRILEPNDYLDTLNTCHIPNLQRDIPIFITHGQEDLLVPVSQADLMAEAILSQFSPSPCEEDSYDCHFKLSKYTNCGHGWIGNNCARNQIVSNIVNWLKEH